MFRQYLKEMKFRQYLKEMNITSMNSFSLKTQILLQTYGLSRLKTHVSIKRPNQEMIPGKAVSLPDICHLKTLDLKNSF